MTDLTQKLKERLEFNKNRLSEYRKAKNKEFAGVPGYWDCIETPDDGAEWENARLSPIHSALARTSDSLGKATSTSGLIPVFLKLFPFGERKSITVYFIA